MPFYEYECSACGHQLEAMQKFSDSPLRKCPACGKSRLKKLMSAPAFRLKGAGWYETDFKSDKEAKRNIAGDDKPSEAAAPAAPAKTDSKPVAAASADKPAEKATAKADKASSSARKSSAKPAAKSKAKAPARKK